MRIGDARVSTTGQNFGLHHDDLKLANNASVDPTSVASLRRNLLLLNELRLTVGNITDKHADM